MTTPHKLATFGDGLIGDDREMVGKFNGREVGEAIVLRYNAHAAMLAALEAAQWGSVGQCPLCGYFRAEDGEHSSRCELATAIQQARGIGTIIDKEA